eukprot:TRINITY_DN11134_c0_g1_i5.p1 TRINITY_DN11134_c0_g1~~TRINITY_DN11134_c0_g1_i5.p1  ORF type:complete len:288 (-),score=38.06 TRINITY_DN11134_c0_g1_i5:155-1018(-)
MYGCLPSSPGQGVTTLVIANVPPDYSQEELAVELSKGFPSGIFDGLDCFFLPSYLETKMDGLSVWNAGKAFLNYRTPEHAEAARQKLLTRLWPSRPGRSSCLIEVASSTIQGIEANYQHFFGTPASALCSTNSLLTGVPSTPIQAPLAASRAARSRASPRPRSKSSSSQGERFQHSISATQGSVDKPNANASAAILAMFGMGSEPGGPGRRAVLPKFPKASSEVTMVEASSSSNCGRPNSRPYSGFRPKAVRDTDNIKYAKKGARPARTGRVGVLVPGLVAEAGRKA